MYIYVGIVCIGTTVYTFWNLELPRGNLCSGFVRVNRPCENFLLIFFLARISLDTIRSRTSRSFWMKFTLYGNCSIGTEAPWRLVVRYIYYIKNARSALWLLYLFFIPKLRDFQHGQTFWNFFFSLYFNKTMSHLNSRRLQNNLVFQW